MARNTSAVKALEKALEQLRNTETAAPATGRPSKKESKGDDKRMEYLLKESRKFGDSLISFYDEEKNKVQSFLDTLSQIESGSYAPRRGGPRKGAGRRAE
jgi:hypothetical protein